MNYAKDEWYTDPNGVMVFSRTGKTIAIIQHNDGEGKANAYLMAASPEMVEALEFFIKLHVEDYIYLDKGIGIATENGKKLIAARKALSKAKVNNKENLTE